MMLLGELLNFFHADIKAVLVDEVNLVFSELFAGKFTLVCELIEDCLKERFFVFCMEIVEDIQEVVRTILFRHVVKDLFLNSTGVFDF
jgi:hypothetical protein